jgi:hypothetical protein
MISEARPPWRTGNAKDIFNLERKNKGTEEFNSA